MPRGSSDVIVTGVAGFIGFHVATRLLSLGVRVAGYDSVNDYYDVGLKRERLLKLYSHDNFVFEEAELADRERVRSVFVRCKPRCVVHLAAQAGVRFSLTNPHAFVSANVDGFLSILEACRSHQVEHLIYASSSSVYGANTKTPFHEDDPVLAPVSLYAATKRSNELMAETYAHLFAIPISGLRFFTVYGPWGRPDMAYFSFTKAIFEGRPIDVYNQGRMRRDFTYIDDVVEAIVKLIEVPPLRAAAALSMPLARPHILYNIGNHTPVELAEFIATIETAVGRKAERRLLPMQAGDVTTTYADVGRLARVTGFTPRTLLTCGIARFVEWYREYYRPSGL